jgi:hypothetical protein
MERTAKLKYDAESAVNITTHTLVNHLRISVVTAAKTTKHGFIAATKESMYFRNSRN